MGAAPSARSGERAFRRNAHATRVPIVTRAHGAEDAETRTIAVAQSLVTQRGGCSATPRTSDAWRRVVVR